MKETTIRKRLSAFFNKNGEMKMSLNNVLYNLQKLSEGKKTHCLSWTYNSGKYKLIGNEIEDRIRLILVSLNIDFEMGNDAPRKGADGSYIEVTKPSQKRKLKQVVSLLKQMN